MNDFVQFFSDSDPSNVSTSIKLMLLLTVLSFAPSILILMTSFCSNCHCSFICSNGTCDTANASEPSDCWIALFLTFFIMAPTFQQVNEEALTPLIQ